MSHESDLLDADRLRALCQYFNIPDTDTLKHRLEDWERWRAIPKSGNVADQICPWCGDPIGLRKPAGGCLVAEKNGYLWHPQCADQREACG